MAYTKHTLAALIEVDPKEAKAQICDAYTKAKASQRDAANVLGVAESTLIRWVRILDLAEAFAKIKRRAHREGWHHEQNQQSPGRPVGWRKSKSA